MNLNKTKTGVLHLAGKHRTRCGLQKTGLTVTTPGTAEEKLAKHYPYVCDGCFPGWRPPEGQQLELPQPTNNP